MAGDWIKVETTLLDKPEVITMSEALGISREEVAGHLLRVWIWWQNVCDSCAVSVRNLCSIDAIARRDGFAKCMIDAGWLQATDDGFVVPNWDRHLSNSAKGRALNAERMRQKRAKSVRKKTHRNRTREEKSVLLQSKSTHAPSAPASTTRMQRPSEGEMEAYAAEIGLPQAEAVKFANHYDANGWRVGRNPMKSWKGAMRNWRANWEEWRARPKSPGHDGDPNSFENSITYKALRNA